MFYLFSKYSLISNATLHSLLYCSVCEGASNYDFGLANKRPYSHAGVEIIWFIYVSGAGLHSSTLLY
jgi:hypothetical protein